jgi:O-antigen/teichoic acid export membrane protein
MPVGRVIFPAFSKDIRRNISIGPKVETYVAATTILLWPAYTVLCFISTPVVLFLFGENWRVAGELMPFLIIGAMIRATIPLPEEILTAYGYVRRLFFSRVCLLVNALSFAVFGALHSLEMFAILQLPASVIFVALNYVFAFPFAQTSIRRLVPFYVKALGLSASCATPALAAYVVYGTEMPSYVLFAALGTAALIWLGGLFSIGHPLEKEMRRLLQTALARMPLRRPKGRA